MFEAKKGLVVRILRQFEPYLKTDMLYLARGGFWLTLGQAASAAMAFMVAIAFANFVPKEVYGTFKFVLAWAGIFGIAALPGLTIALVRSVAQGKEGAVQEALRAKARWGLIGAAAALGFAGYYFFKDNTVLAGSFLVVSLLIVPFSTFQVYSSFLNGRKEFRAKSVYQVVANLAATVPLIATLLVTDNLIIIVAAYFASWSLVYWYFERRTARIFIPNKEPDPGFLTYGKHLSAMEVVGAVARQLDKLLLFHFIGAVEVAVYSMAVAPITQVQGVQKGLYNLALPKLSLRTQEEIRSTLVRRMVTLCILSIPPTVAYILAAPYLFAFLFPQYLDAVWYSQLYALILFFSAASALPSAAMDAHREIKRKYVVKVVGNGARIICIIAGIPWGITGIMIGTLVSTLSSTLLATALVLWKGRHERVK